MPGNSAWAVKRRERDAAAITFSRDKRLSFRALAAELGCNHESARKAVNRHMALLDQASLDRAAAIREHPAQLGTVVPPLGRWSALPRFQRSVQLPAVLDQTLSTWAEFAA